MKLLPFPKAFPEWRRREVEKLRGELNDPAKTYSGDDGVLRWKSNNRIIPPCVFRDDALVEVPEGHEEAYRKELDAFLGEYREARRNMSAEAKAEERAMARAAHGPGVTLVNVITGEKYTT